MSPVLVLVGFGIVLFVLWTIRKLPGRHQQQFWRTVFVVLGIVGVLLLIRIGLPWLAAVGAVAAAALRWLTPLLIRLLPLLMSRRFKREPGATEALPPTPGSSLTHSEALEILGLTADASDEEVREAHASLIKKVHPDRGGTTYLATRVNLARDLLLTRHKP